MEEDSELLPSIQLVSRCKRLPPLSFRPGLLYAPILPRYSLSSAQGHKIKVLGVVEASRAAADGPPVLPCLVLTRPAVEAWMNQCMDYQTCTR